MSETPPPPNTAAQSQLPQGQLDLYSPCHNRSSIFELASLFVLGAAIGTALWGIYPSIDLDFAIRAYFQDKGFTRSLETDIRMVWWILVTTFVATSVYMLRLLMSLFAFDGVRLYCTRYLTNIGKFASQLEWWTRLLVVVFLLACFSGLLDLSQLFSPALKWLLSSGPDSPGLIEDVRLSELEGILITFAMLTTALTALFLWSVVVSFSMWVNSNAESDIDWGSIFFRFFVGPIANILIFYLVALFILDPDLIATHPYLFGVFIFLCFAQICYGVGGIIGLRVRVTLSPLGLEFPWDPGFFSQVLGMLQGNGESACARNQSCPLREVR